MYNGVQHFFFVFEQLREKCYEKKESHQKKEDLNDLFMPNINVGLKVRIVPFSRGMLFKADDCLEHYEQ